jgi:hypothetical protein
MRLSKTLRTLGGKSGARAHSLAREHFTGAAILLALVKPIAVSVFWLARSPMAQSGRQKMRFEPSKIPLMRKSISSNFSSTRIADLKPRQRCA